MSEFTRRDFLSAAASVAAAGSAASLMAQEKAEPKQKQLLQAAPKKEGTVNQNDLAICDTHQHLWDLTKFKLPWLKGDAVQSINRSFLMSDYLKLIGSHKVVKTVYMEVNVAPDQQAAEAEYVLDLCRRLGVEHASKLEDRQLVIVRHGKLRLALCVDSVRDPEELPRENVLAAAAIGGAALGALREALRAVVKTTRGHLPVIEPRALVSRGLLDELSRSLRPQSEPGGAGVGSGP